MLLLFLLLLVSLFVLHQSSSPAGVEKDAGGVDGRAERRRFRYRPLLRWKSEVGGKGQGSTATDACVGETIGGSLARAYLSVLGGRRGTTGISHLVCICVGRS